MSRFNYGGYWIHRPNDNKPVFLWLSDIAWCDALNQLAKTYRVVLERLLCEYAEDWR